MSKPQPIAVSDHQLDTIMTACAPLPPADRSSFLVELAALLRTERELGDGTIDRAVRFLLRRYFRPPDVPRQTAVHDRKNVGPAIE
jgi:hypothetical protein